MTRIFEDPPGAAAGRAGRRRDDLAEKRLRRATDLARAAASGARLLAGSGFRSAARAAVARRRPRNVDLPLDAGEGLLECDGQVVAKIVTAVGALAPCAAAETAAEEGVEDVRERHVGEIDRGASRADGGVAEEVVASPALRVGQNRVRLARLLEAVVRRAVVRMAVG